MMPAAADAGSMIQTLNRDVICNGKALAGVDEVGRGPLAGPVIAAAVILDPARPVAGLDDSKALSEARREALAERIQAQARAWALGRAEPGEIDELNILRASLLAMARAVRALSLAPDYVLVDGRVCPDVACPSIPVIRGDQSIVSISAASIVAKVARDREMIALDDQYPGYGFARHKGYPTKAHLQALQSLGVSVIHRRSFAPVRACL